MTVTVRFACGHQANVETVDAPQCVICGETRVQMVKAPQPRIRGAVSSPCAVKE
jgi:hypothetical protein